MRFPLLSLERAICFLVYAAVLTGCQESYLPSEKSAAGAAQFTLAVVPDTQNMVDYRHQTAVGFAVDGAAMFVDQMQYLADNAVGNGGDIAFVASVGDVWQHQTSEVDPDHRSRGLIALDLQQGDPAEIKKRIAENELPLAKRGYDIIAKAKLPFAVAPGNHDYDESWLDSRFQPHFDRIGELLDSAGRLIKMDPAILGMEHLGGNTNFDKVFGSNSSYFKDQEWYIDSFNGGSNSAQIFCAGGYTFLHLALEMQPGDKVLAWAQKVIDSNPGLPTIVTTHDYLNGNGERLPMPALDLVRADPLAHNSAEALWQDFISVNDQIFLVLCGHQKGQAFRVDENTKGHQVYQLMSNYQDRGHSGPLGENGVAKAGIGDGWIRLLRFNMALPTPVLSVRTYSTYYGAYANEFPQYAAWYKDWEKPSLSDSEFIKTDSFTITLTDFKSRFNRS